MRQETAISIFPIFRVAVIIAVITSVIIAIKAPTVSAAPDAAPRSWAELEDLHRLIVPSGEELAWLEIPWLTDLWEARRRAAESGKPIFLWEMDGHPLGCT